MKKYGGANMELHLFEKWNIGDIYWYNNPIPKKSQEEMDEENIPHLRGNRPMLIIEKSKGMITGILSRSTVSNYHQIQMKNGWQKQEVYNWSVVNLVTFRPCDQLIGDYIGNIPLNIITNINGRNYTAGYPSRELIVNISHQPDGKLISYNDTMYIVLMTKENKSLAVELEKVYGVDNRETRIYYKNEYFKVDLNKVSEMTFDLTKVSILATVGDKDMMDLRYAFLVYRPEYEDQTAKVKTLEDEILELKGKLAVAESKLEGIFAIYRSSVQETKKLVVVENVVESKPACHNLDCFKKTERLKLADKLEKYFTPNRPRKYRDIKSAQDLMDYMSLYKDEERTPAWYTLKSDMKKSINMDICPLEIVQSFNKNFADLR